MENKFRLFLLILPLLVSILGAQEYRVDRSDGEIRFIQRLTWQADEFALRYEVVIEGKIPEEKPAVSEEPALPEETALPEGTELPVETVFPGDAGEKEEIFLEVFRDFTDTASIEFSLPSGFYRYRITVYDLLDRPGEASEWARFEIIQALEPELHNFSPEFFYLDGNDPWILNLTGLNLSADAEVYLRHTENGLTITPREYSGESSLSNARLVFDIQQLVPGIYEIYLKNPGGLDTIAGTFEIGFNKTPGIYIGAAYAPFIPIYGKLDRLENSPIFPLGAALRFGWVPFKKSWGHLGLELAPSWNGLSSGNGSNKVSFHFLGAEANVLYLKWLSNRITAVTFRAGAGLAGTSDMLLPQAQAGAAFLWFFHKPFFMETGIDFIHRFTGSNHSPGYLRPWLGVGIRL
ncbi:MAG: hypothetical protein LBB72_01020 [Spirochaetaceae bacterium]|jgi:hypothetical protein|nr:hypothetical protein [Spirochaetaceae bacterium]